MTVNELSCSLGVPAIGHNLRQDVGMDRKHSSDQKANRRARERLKQAERGDLESAEELNQTDAADDGAAVSAEQEAADGPEGRGLPR